jgi:hypothetical protein
MGWPTRRGKPPTERTCSRCKQTKPIARFYRGYSPCHDCRAQQAAEYRQRHPLCHRRRDPVKHRTYQREWHRKKVTRGRTPPPVRWWDAMHAACELGISVGHLYHLTRKGVIKGEKYLGRWAIDPASVAEYARWRGIP